MKRIDRRQFIRKSAAASAALAGGAAIAHLASAADNQDSPPRRRPNVIFILADDLGWSDAGCYGSGYHETRNIDKLASQGMRFTDAYAAAPTCSPTRASILTGKYPARLHLTQVDFGPRHRTFTHAGHKQPDYLDHLPLEEVTIAEALKAAGYTTGCVGKWHLGKQDAHQPGNQGFDFLNLTRGVHDFSGRKFKSPTDALEDVPASGWPKDAVTDAALEFIQANKDRPFFLYLPHYLVHAPILTRNKRLYEKYKAKAGWHKQHNPFYASMVETLDWSVGRVMAKLDELGLAEDTIVFFFSDNGALRGDRFSGPNVTDNWPLRGGKVSLQEGGIREPLIVRWPRAVKPATTCDVPVTSVDFYPTILSMTGAPGQAQHNRNVDGLDLTVLLRQSGRLERDAIFWHYPHLPFIGAARKGGHKLIYDYISDWAELFDLADDISESHDLAAKMPDKVAELKALHQKWLKDVGAQMPVPVEPKSPAPQGRDEGEGKG